MKDLTDQIELTMQIPKTAREFRFGKMILIITKSKQGTYGFVIKNEEDPKHHHTLVAKNEPDFHYTQESDGITPNQHQSLDYESLLANIGKSLQSIFSTAQKIELDDSRFTRKNVLMLISQKIIIAEKTPKKVIFDQKIEYKESMFEDIDTSENCMGVVFNENGEEQNMLIIQNGDIFIIDLDNFEPENSKINDVFRPAFGSDIK